MTTEEIRDLFTNIQRDELGLIGIEEFIEKKTNKGSVTKSDLNKIHTKIRKTLHEGRIRCASGLSKYIKGTDKDLLSRVMIRKGKRKDYINFFKDYGKDITKKEFEKEIFNQDIVKKISVQKYIDIIENLESIDKEKAVKSIIERIEKGLEKKEKGEEHELIEDIKKLNTKNLLSENQLTRIKGCKKIVKK